jgi:hypothetical protein
VRQSRAAHMLPSQHEVWGDSWCAPDGRSLKFIMCMYMSPCQKSVLPLLLRAAPVLLPHGEPSVLRAISGLAMMGMLQMEAGGAFYIARPCVDEPGPRVGLGSGAGQDDLFENQRSVPACKTPLLVHDSTPCSNAPVASCSLQECERFPSRSQRRIAYALWTVVAARIYIVHAREAIRMHKTECLGCLRSILRACKSQPKREGLMVKLRY